jgi:hypothetical protein
MLASSVVDEPAFQCAFLAIGYLAAGSADRLESFTTPSPAAVGLAEELAHADRSVRARGLARELEQITRHLEARRLA